MVITTTNSVEGKQIVAYKGIVFWEVMSGINFVKDFTASMSDFLGGCSKTYESELIDARINALRELEERGYGLGANAVVAVKLDYETLGQNNGMLMVTASGTAVVVE
ncbi:MAG: heavy metal-binding domain-containing protein [Clostridium sp.]|nr:heavy metal-binding domain-containing protein [Clostridium sp.]